MFTNDENEALKAFGIERVEASPEEASQMNELCKEAVELTQSLVKLVREKPSLKDLIDGVGDEMGLGAHSLGRYARRLRKLAAMIGLKPILTGLALQGDREFARQTMSLLAGPNIEVEVMGIGDAPEEPVLTRRNGRKFDD